MNRENNEEMTNSIINMISKVSLSLDGVANIKHGSFDDMPDEVHLMIMDNLFQNDKLTYGLLGKRYNPLAVASLFRKVGVVRGESQDMLYSYDSMPYHSRGGMTVVGSRIFGILVSSGIWAKHTHLVKTLVITKASSDDGMTIPDILESLPGHDPDNSMLIPLYSDFEDKISPTQLDLRITDTVSGPIPSHVRKLSIAFDGARSMDSQKQQLQCWSKNFRSLTSLRVWNLEFLEDVINKTTLNLKEEQTLDLESLYIQCEFNSWAGLHLLFNPAKVKSLFLQGAFNGWFISQCNNLSSLSLLYDCRLHGTVAGFGDNPHYNHINFVEELRKITLSKHLVEFRTNARVLVEDPIFLSECGKLQTLCLVPILSERFERTNPRLNVEWCKRAISFVRRFKETHPSLDYIQFGMEFHIVKEDGQYVESVLKPPFPRDAILELYENSFNDEILSRRHLKGLMSYFYEYYIV